MIRLRTLFAALAVFLALGMGVAFAHAHLSRSAPAADSTASVAPKEIRLWFTRTLEPNLSSLEVTDATGHSVAQGKMRLDPEDAKQMVLALTALKAGSYKVAWKAVSVDSHTTNGDFAFTVAQGAAQN